MLYIQEVSSWDPIYWIQSSDVTQ